MADLPLIGLLKYSIPRIYLLHDRWGSRTTTTGKVSSRLPNSSDKNAAPAHLPIRHEEAENKAMRNRYLEPFTTQKGTMTPHRPWLVSELQKTTVRIGKALSCWADRPLSGGENKDVFVFRQSWKCQLSLFELSWGPGGIACQMEYGFQSEPHKNRLRRKQGHTVCRFTHDQRPFLRPAKHHKLQGTSSSGARIHQAYPSSCTGWRIVICFNLSVWKHLLSPPHISRVPPSSYRPHTQTKGIEAHFMHTA